MVLCTAFSLTPYKSEFLRQLVNLSNMRPSRDGQIGLEIHCLPYLSNGTRPDIAHAVMQLNHQYMQGLACSSPAHLVAGKKILEDSTKPPADDGSGLRYHRVEEERPPSWVDASFGNKNGMRRSRTRCDVTLVRAAIHWIGHVQRNERLFSTETEYVGMCRGAQKPPPAKYSLPEADRAHSDV